MHLRMFELARDEVTARGYIVLGGYLSPVNDAYNKKDLISSIHRIKMCEMACDTSSFVMVDPWEANQSCYQRSLTVLTRIQKSLLKLSFIDEGFVTHFNDKRYQLHILYMFGFDVMII